MNDWFLLMFRMNSGYIGLLVLCVAFAGCQSDRPHARRRTAKTFRQPQPRAQLVELPAPTLDDTFSALPPTQQYSKNNGLPLPSAIRDAGPDATNSLPDSELPELSLNPVSEETSVTAATEKATVGVATLSVPMSRDEATELLEAVGAKLSRDPDNRVHRIDLAYRPFSDSQRQWLHFFPGVTELDLTGTDVTDAAISEIVNLSRLHSLKLKGTAVTDSGVQQLAELTSLRLLDLGRTAITDDAIADLQSLKQLQYLLLNHTQISDGAIKHLARLRSLRGLNLVGAEMTAAEVERLQQQHPGCLIVSQPSDDLTSISMPSEFRLTATDVDAAYTEDPKLRRLMRLVHEDPDLAKHLASVYSDQGDWSDAAAILQVGVNARPNDEILNLALAEALASAGRADEAYRLFRRFSDESDARLAVGSIVYRNATTTATKWLERSMTANPNNQRARDGLQQLKQHESEAFIDIADIIGNASRLLQQGLRFAHRLVELFLYRVRQFGEIARVIKQRLRFILQRGDLIAYLLQGARSLQQILRIVGRIKYRQRHGRRSQ
mgnify:CR=1 FL=1